MGNGDDGPGYQQTRPGNTRGRRVLNQVDIEEKMIALDAQLEDLLEHLHDQATEKADAEWMWEKFRAVTGLKASAEPGNGPGGRTTVDEREARIIERDTDDLFRTHLIKTAMFEVTKEQLHARRDQMRMLQTIAANIRAMT